MISLLILFGLVGLTLIITTADITEDFRDWFVGRFDCLHKLFSCAMCTGFWIGALYGVGLWLFKDVTLWWSFILGGSISAGAFTLDLLWKIMERMSGE